MTILVLAGLVVMTIVVDGMASYVGGNLVMIIEIVGNDFIEKIILVGSHFMSVGGKLWQNITILFTVNFVAVFKTMGDAFVGLSISLSAIFQLFGANFTTLGANISLIFSNILSDFQQAIANIKNMINVGKRSFESLTGS